MPGSTAVGGEAAAALRAAHEREVRRGPDSDGSGVVVEVTSRVARWSSRNGIGWSEIAWSNLDEADADEVIADQIAYFADRDESFVWRRYDADQPADLGDRLTRAGLTAEDHSTLMIADVTSVPRDVELADEITLVAVDDAAGVDQLIAVHEDVFGTDHSQLRRSILAQLDGSTSITALVVATVDGRPVSSARIEFLPARSFASLWGGGTLPEWRGRGIYRALVAHRARLAVARGYHYLYVTASSESRPILERIGFVPVAAVTTYGWHPSSDTVH